jgi:hypothetical protein
VKPFSTATERPRQAITQQWQPRRTGISARAIGSFVPKLTRKTFEKYGFSAVALLTDWAAIVGPDMAKYTQPDRLKWPRGVDAFGDVEDGAEGRPGATLVLRVEGSRALDVQYRARQVIDRINAYFGYRAVAELRLIQAPVGPPEGVAAVRTAAALNSAKAPVDPALAASIEAVADEGLKAALARLCDSVTARHSPSGR